MPFIHTVIDIDATPAHVWSILSDLPNYGRWNPVLVEVRGWLEVGAPLDLRVALGTKPVTLGARVLRVEPERELRWRGPRSKVLGRVLAGEHYFLLEPTAGGCRLVHGELFTGIAASIAVTPLLPRLERAYASMNAALKRAAEAPARTPSA
jgi:hypothetical protein